MYILALVIEMKALEVADAPDLMRKPTGEQVSSR